MRARFKFQTVSGHVLVGNRARRLILRCCAASVRGGRGRAIEMTKSLISTDKLESGLKQFSFGTKGMSEAEHR